MSEIDPAQALAVVVAYEAVMNALNFYADPASYFAIGFFPDPPTGAFMDDFDETDLGYKPGKLAREALNTWFRAVGVEE